MTGRHRFVRWGVALSGAVLAAGLFTPAMTAQAEDPAPLDEIGKIKKATDEPGWDHGVRRLSPRRQAEIDAKRQSVQRLSVVRNRNGAQVTAAAAALPIGAVLPKNHQAQQYSNYCGPASMSMALNHMGVNWSQATIAKKVGISPGRGGTDWGDFINVANSAPGSFAWDDQQLAYTPTTAEKSAYKTRLLASINGQTGSGLRYPLVGDAWEVSGGPHLPGHPANQTIFHWFHIRGYEQSGAQTWIQDPATSVWSGVPAHSLNDSNKLVTIMGGRGYLY